VDGRRAAEGRSRPRDPARLTHYNIFSSPLLAAVTLAFLDDQPG
jgi:hypothetical protein